VILIDDPDDTRLQAFRLNERGLMPRPDRRRDAGTGLFLAEGDLVVERALAAGCEPVAALVDPLRVPDVAHRLGIELYGAGTNVRRLATGLGMPHPIIALFRRPPRPTVAQVAAGAHRLLIVEALDNPSNVGAIVRSAVAFAWDGLVLDATSADPLARRSLRVAMGTAFSLPHARSNDLAADLVGLDDFAHYALTPATDAIDIETLVPAARCTLIVGSERAGLSDEVLAVATARVRIPIADGVDSLNAAAAVAIACWSLRAR
jgi:tRNA G18 (ribose-2'-O)-methylase SpoU